jgi:hypothetical protein
VAHFSRIGLSLLAACTIAAISAGIASALPEVGRCVSQPGTGRYRDAGCIEKAGSPVEQKKFEWSKGAGGGSKAFAVAGGEAGLETERGTKLVCKTVSGTGEYHEVNGVINSVTKEVLAFRGCMYPIVDVGCNSQGGVEGELVTNPLKGKLAYISGKGTKTPVVGQELTPMIKGGKVATCKVLGNNGAIGEGAGKGGNRIISTVSGLDVMSMTSGEAFAASASGVQSPQSFEGLFKIANLEWRLNEEPWERMSWSLEATTSNEQPLEIKAIP